MKNPSIWALGSILLLITSCSDFKTLPQYVSVEKLNSLSSGMNKETVANELGAEPFDAFHGTESGCELYSYKYLHKKQEINPERKEQPSSLRGNLEVYEDVNDVYLFFNDGKLSNVVTADASADPDFVAELQNACEGPSAGCSDPEALNYDEDAIEDDGSCEFCPCDYYKNPDYDEERGCGEQCLPINPVDDEANAEDDAESCSLCDVVAQATGDVNLTITSGDFSGRGVAKASTSSNTKAVNIPSLGRKKKSSQGQKSSKDASKSKSKKLEKLEAQLAKSIEKDSKKGKESRQTQLLRSALAKLSERK
jgi:hypothetical protein